MIMCVIPARGGSVRVPGKNIKPFRGQAMLCYPIEVAKASGLFRLIVVSTDDDEIERIALEAGAVVLRRKPDDGVRGTQEVAKDVFDQFPTARCGCVVYPCTPLLDVSSLRRGYAALFGSQFAMSVDAQGNDIGCFYWGQASAFRAQLPLAAPHTARVPMAPERCCDINTAADWARAESLYDALRRAP